MQTLRSARHSLELKPIPLCVSTGHVEYGKRQRQDKRSWPTPGSVLILERAYRCKRRHSRQRQPVIPPTDKAEDDIDVPWQRASDGRREVQMKDNGGQVPKRERRPEQS